MRPNFYIVISSARIDNNLVGGARSNDLKTAFRVQNYLTQPVGDKVSLPSQLKKKYIKIVEELRPLVHPS